MKTSEPRQRIVLPSLVWLLLAIASFVAAFGVWQNQRLDRLRPPASVAPAPSQGAAAGGPAATAAADPLAPALPAGTSPATAPALAGAVAASSSEEPASAALRQLDPQAGRQVLRCVSKGRVTYRDLNAGCPDGAAERVTVFPTEGVGRPQ